MSEQKGTMTIADQSAQIRKLLDDRTREIAAALPPGGALDENRFKRVVLTLCARNTDLLKCNPASLIRAVMESAQLGLAPDPVLGESWYVPFKGIVQMIPGYRGLVKLAWQSDRIAKIAARPVYDGDIFEVEYGAEERLIHIPKHKTKTLTNVYSVAKVKGGETMFHTLTKEECDAVRARSPAGRSNYSPWHTDYDAMALKSTLRRLCKLLPLSTTDQRLSVALDHDMRAEHGLKQQFTAPLLGGESEPGDAPLSDEEAARAEDLTKGDA